MPGRTPAQFEVVGVVRDAKHLGLKDRFEPMAFFPVAQDTKAPDYVNLLVAWSTPPAEGSIAAAVAGVDPAAVLLVVSLETQLADQVVRERMLAILSGAFGGAAALLAMLGLYGVVAYGVTQRVREIGIRLALGARPATLLRTVLSGSAWLAAAGVTLGLGAAALTTPCLEQLLFGLRPLDPATFGGVAVAFLILTVVAAYIPARRAPRIDPLAALREDA